MIAERVIGLSRLDLQDNPLFVLAIIAAVVIFVVGALVKAVAAFIIKVLIYLLLIPFVQQIAAALPFIIPIVIITWITMSILKSKDKTYAFLYVVSFPLAYSAISNVAVTLIAQQRGIAYIDIRDGLGNVGVIDSIAGVVIYLLLFAICIAVAWVIQYLFIDFLTSLFAPRTYYSKLKTYGTVSICLSIFAALLFAMSLVLSLVLNGTQGYHASNGIPFASSSDVAQNYVVMLTSLGSFAFLLTVGILLRIFARKFQLSAEKEMMKQNAAVKPVNTSLCINCGCPKRDNDSFCGRCGMRF